MFMWRLCRNNIPVRTLLRSRGVATTIICPMCETDIEHLRHLFCECPFAKECWHRSGLNIDAYDVEEVPSWFLEMLSKETPEIIQKMAIVLSGIWFARNKKVWEGKLIQAAITMDLSSKQVQEWQEAIKRSSSVNRGQNESGSNEQIRWKCLDVGWLKVNVDASVVQGANMYTLGLVIQNDSGQFVMGKVLKIAGGVSVMEAEARGVLEAIKWIESMSLYRVAIESDSQMVVHALRSMESYQLEVGHVLDECLDRFRNRVDLSICHVKKQANKAAHFMARASCLLDSYNCFTSPPDLLLEMVPSEFPS